MKKKYFEKFAKSIWGGGEGGGRQVYHILMHIASSSDCSLPTLNLPFKVILRRFEVVF